MSPAPLVVAVIPVHNRLWATSRFLDAVHNINYPNLRLVVIDDGSTDGTTEWIQSHHPKVQLLHTSGDCWWAGATNLGIAWALQHEARYILTINDDSTVDPEFLTNLVATAEANPGAVVGSRIMQADHPERIWSLGGHCRWSDNRLWVHLHQGRDWPVVTLALPELLEVDTVCGNGTLIPAQVFRQVGFYDAGRLPQYHADADLVLRAARHGWRVLVDCRSAVFNDPGSTQTLTGLWWSLTSKRSPLYLPALLTILNRWCPPERRGLLLLGQFLPILLPFLRRQCASSS